MHLIFDHTLILLLYTRYYVHLFQNVHIILLCTIITKEIQEILFTIHLNYISIRQLKDKGLNNNRTIKLNLNPCEISETELERHLHGSSISASSHRALFTSVFCKESLRCGWTSEPRLHRAVSPANINHTKIEGGRGEAFANNAGYLGQWNI